MSGCEDDISPYLNGISRYHYVIRKCKTFGNLAQTKCYHIISSITQLKALVIWLSSNFYKLFPTKKELPTYVNSPYWWAGFL